MKHMIDPLIFSTRSNDAVLAFIIRFVLQPETFRCAGTRGLTGLVRAIVRRNA
jgi:hypothetical protein